MNSLLLNALQFKNTERPPVWLMRQAGRYMPSYQALRAKHSFLELCHTPELIHTVTHLPIDELAPDAAILFSDILMIPEALGFNVVFHETKGPIIENHLKSPHEIDQFSVNGLKDRLTFLPPAIAELKKSLLVPLIGFTGAPFTLASYIIEGKTSRDLKTTKKWAYQDPAGFEKIMKTLEEGIIASLKLQLDAGCDALQLFDSWAQVLNQAHFDKWCLQPLKRIAAALKPWNKPLIYFCRGSSYLAPQIAETGASAVSLDWIFPIEGVRKALPNTPLQGNLDPEALYLPRELLVKEVQGILTKMKGDKGYVFNLGHGILPDVPYENVRALIETVKGF
jgi:uroporphyrinogen decarboxylase